MVYGFELILDLHGCDRKRFNRKSLRGYFKNLCKAIDMTRSKLVFWDDVGVPIEEQETQSHTKGTSAVQFILTSNITVHTLDLLDTVYINIFSCKWFSKFIAKKITKEWFAATRCSARFIKRI